jgi:hypothetical protein
METPQTLKFHDVVFTKIFKGVYKSKQTNDELYIDSEVKTFGPAGEKVKILLIVNHLPIMESRWCNTYEEGIEILETQTKPFLKLKP